MSIKSHSFLYDKKPTLKSKTISFFAFIIRITRNINEISSMTEVKSLVWLAHLPLIRTLWVVFKLLKGA